jgi:hypothetical protein
MKTQTQWLFEIPFPSTSVSYISPYSSLVSETEWLFETPPVAPVAPSLFNTESKPEGTTLYVEIPLGGESPARPMTGIFIPTNYRPQEQVDLILYLHGHHRNTPVKGKQPTHGYWPTTLSIDQHWRKDFYPYYAFREGVNASKKNVILVAPTLGPRSQTVNLVKPGGLDSYLQQVLLSLNSYGSYQGRQQPPVLGSLILACHSGGGKPMRQIALAKNNYSQKIKECWGFDCTYSGSDIDWVKWAKINPNSRLYVYSATKTPRYYAIKLEAESKKMRLSNILFEKSTTQNHFKVPLAHWRSRIESTPFLRDR